MGFAWVVNLAVGWGFVCAAFARNRIKAIKVAIDIRFGMKLRAATVAVVFDSAFDVNPR